MSKPANLNFRCSLQNCDFTSMDIKASQKHLESCGKQKSFECFVCDQCFTSKKILSEHHLVKHGYVDEYQGIDEQKMEVDSSGSTLVCPICQRAFDKDRALVDHLLKDHMNGLKTEKPDFEESVKIKTEPMDESYGIEPLPIKIESIKSEAPEWIQIKKEPLDESTIRIESIKSQSGSFKCQLCHESFGIKKSLHHHLVVKHLNQKFQWFQCPYCELNDFKDFLMLQNHVKAKHRRKKMTFKCQICAKTYPDSSDLIKHSIECHLKIRYQCKVCLKRMYSKSKFMDHMKNVHKK